MIAPAADPYRFQSGVLAVAVHAAFFALLIFGITWQAKEPAGVVVDLWSNLPTLPESKPAIKPIEPPPPTPEPVKPEPVKKVAPKPAPPMPVKSPDIALKEKRVQEEKRKQEQLKQEQLKQEQARLAEVARQQQARDDLAKRAQAQQAAAQQSIVNVYTGRIQSRIQSKLYNKSLCGDGKPQLEFDIALLPTGQLRSNPILRKGSGLAACDKAVENAILLSEPLPVPPQPEAFIFFRELHLKFRPNE